MSEWIPCDEKRPEYLSTVLVFVPSHARAESGRVFTGHFSTAHGWCVAGDGPRDSITHWMPLPEGPGKETV